MTTKNFTRAALSLVAFALMACTSKKEETKIETTAVADPAQIKTEIQAMETAFADGMNAGKPDSIIYYADDASSFSQDKPVAVGKAAIQKMMQEQVAESPKGAKIMYTTDEIFPSSDGNQVVELGSYKLSDSTNVDIATGNFMALFQKRDGKYVGVRDMGVSNKPKK